MLGRVLYCMLTGLPARSFPTLPPELITPERQRETKLLNRLVTRACDPDPEKRFQSAQEFIAAIKRTRGEIERGDVWTRRRVLASVGGAAVVAAIGTPWVAARWSTAGGIKAGWTPLFDGVSLDGWEIINPWTFDPWWAEGGTIVARDDKEYKSLHYIKPLGFGRFRATVTPTRDAGRLGLSYGQPEGSYFLLFEDKYVWIRDGKEPGEAEVPGRWLSFPGPVIPAGGESITMEVDWGPRTTRLLVNGQLLQEVRSHRKGTRLGLHVWGGDGGRYSDIAFLPQA